MRAYTFREHVDRPPQRVWDLLVDLGFFDFEVEPDGSGSRVTHTLDLKAHSVLTWLFLPLIARGERTRRTDLLGNLKRLVEATSS